MNHIGANQSIAQLRRYSASTFGWNKNLKVQGSSRKDVRLKLLKETSRKVVRFNVAIEAAKSGGTVGLS